MASLDQAFDTVADAGMWEEAAAVLAGFLAPSIVANIAEGTAPFDVPDEAYGIAVMVLGNYAPAYGSQISLGGGVYTVDKLAQRFGVKNQITSIGGE